MARPLRLEYEDALYHVTGRGNGGAAIFVDDADRRRWLSLLGEIALRRAWRVWSWCQMGNHYHLVVETPAADLGRGLRDLNGVYTQAFNRHHGRSGHVLQGRYHAVLVERDAHLLEVCRYVALNPVRAGLCRAAADWPWSAHRAQAGLAPAPAWLAAADLHRLIGTTGRKAGPAWAAFVAEGSRPLWDDLKHQVWLGSERWIAAQQARIAAPERLLEVPRAQRLPAASLVEIAAAAPDRRSAMRTARATGAYTLRAIATHFAVHPSTVSRSMR